jgi:hypothetical protein
MVWHIDAALDALAAKFPAAFPQLSRSIFGLVEDGM